MKAVSYNTRADVEVKKLIVMCGKVVYGAILILFFNRCITVADAVAEMLDY